MKSNVNIQKLKNELDSIMEKLDDKFMLTQDDVFTFEITKTLLDEIESEQQ